VDDSVTQASFSISAFLQLPTPPPLPGPLLLSLEHREEQLGSEWLLGVEGRGADGLG
jgi:hypothetical protein